jgi:polar amino acid transport system substrate-binding protein
MVTMNKIDNMVKHESVKDSLPESGLTGIKIIAVCLAVVICADWFMLNHIEKTTRSDVSDNLNSLLNSTAYGMSEWIDDFVSVVEIWSESEQIKEITRNQIELAGDRQALLESPYLAHLRKIYDDAYRPQGYLGFFLVLPDGLSIASSRDSNVGIKNLMFEREAFFKKVFSGQSGFTLPMVSDVPLPDKNGNLVDGYPTMFIAAPVRNDDGRVIAMLTLRIDPTKSFTQHAHIGNFGETGETYAFSEDGTLITESRFENQLNEAGLVIPPQKSILYLQLREPRGNILDGYIPEEVRKDQPLTLDVRLAIDENAGVCMDGFADYRGVEVVGAWRWLDDLGFGITTKIDKDEAFSSYSSTRITILSVLIAAVGIFLFFSIFLLRSRNKIAGIAKKAFEDEEKLAAVINAAIDGVISINSKGEVELFNPAAETIFGYSAEEMIGRPVSSLIPSPDALRHGDYINEYIKSGKKNIIGKKVESEARRKDGSSFPIELSINELILGDELKFVGIIRDLSRRKQAEEQLQAFFNLSLDMLCIAGFDGFFKQVNPAFEKTLGYSQEELLEPTFFDFIHPDDQEAAMTILQQLIGGGVTNNLQLRFKTKSGDWRWLSWTAVSIPRNSRIYATARDITDDKKVAEQLAVAKQKAEEASVAKSEFLAQMSHEIRTPINIVIGMSELILDTKMDREQQNYLKMITESANSLLQIINDILDFSKIEAGKLEIETIDFSLRDSLTGTIHTLALAAQTKGLEIAWHVPSDVPDKLIGDPGRIRQVVTNLVSNAIKFTESGEVLLNVVKMNDTDLETTLRFSVKDTGIGIPPEKQQRIFEAFEQSDSFTTRKYGGTGLGLSISSRLIQLMGGNIWLESEPGKGSTFHFSINLKKNLDANGSFLKDEIKQLDNMNVLLAADKGFTRHVLEEILESWDMNPVPVESAEKTLEYLGNVESVDDTVHLIIIDSDLSVKDGFELAKELKENENWKSIPMIMLTLPVRSNDVPKCLKLGIKTYTNKPVSESELMNTVLEAMGLFTIGSDGGEQGQDTGNDWKGRSMKILVADDNLGNQLLVERLLDKWGHKSVVVENGKKALDAMKNDKFDLILMDVNMPEMNGFLATSVIRKREKEQELERIPIIALTAHALKGDRERCLKAGMDGYVSKPIQRNLLKEAINSVMSLTDEDIEEVRESVSGDNKDIFDGDEYVDRLEGETELIIEMVEMFLQEHDRLIDELGKTIENGNTSQVEHKAHELKGWVGNLSAGRCHKTAQTIENKGNSGDLDGVEEMFDVLKDEVDKLVNELNKFIKEQKI